MRSGLVYQKTGGGKSEKVSCPKNMKNVIHFKEVKKKPPPARFDINLKPPEEKTCSKAYIRKVYINRLVRRRDPEAVSFTRLEKGHKRR